MKNKFYLTLTVIFLFFTACEEENVNPIKATTQTTLIKVDKKIEKITTKEDNTSSIEVKKYKKYKFIFKDLNNHSSTLTVQHDIYHFTNIKQPIVMVTLFSTWCPPCRGQIPHLTNLQKKFKEHLFILSALVHDDISDTKLDKFIISEKVLFFLSKSQKENLKFANNIVPKLGLEKNNFPLPLMIIFVNGKYFTHYEGIMPEEMIESDIKQVLKKIKR